MKPRSVILLSGGLDSTVSAAIAKRHTSPVFALTFNYGQGAAGMEIVAARKICRALQIRHKVIRLPFFSEFKKCVMLRSNKKLKEKSLDRLKDVWVPNRNGLFISIAACFAEYYGAKYIITGFNREEARQFPDNSESFINAMNRSLTYSTLTNVKVRSYVSGYSKRRIYELGRKNNAPLDYVYSCYLGGKKMCGKCASCKRLIAARKRNPLP